MYLLSAVVRFIIRPFLIGVKKHWIWIWNLGSNWFV